MLPASVRIFVCTEPQDRSAYFRTGGPDAPPLPEPEVTIRFERVEGVSTAVTLPQPAAFRIVDSDPVASLSAGYVIRWEPEGYLVYATVRELFNGRSCITHDGAPASLRWDVESWNERAVMRTEGYGLIEGADECPMTIEICLVFVGDLGEAFGGGVAHSMRCQNVDLVIVP